jgi:hypothetical protein
MYRVYSSTHNKETLRTLQFDFTLPEFMVHMQWCVMQEDLEREANELAEADSKR